MQILLYGSIAWRHPFGLRQVMDWAKEFGWDGIDARGLSLDIPGDVRLRLNAFGYDMLGPRQIRKSARKQFRDLMQETGIHLSGIYCSSPVNLSGDAGQHYRQLFCDFLHLGADLGVDWIRSINNTTTDGKGGQYSEEEAFDKTVEGLKEVAPLAAELGVGILLENNENTATPDAESMVRLQSEIGNLSKVGITYDPVNAYFQGKNVEQGFDILAGKIDVLHVKNVKRFEEKRWDYVPRGDFSYQWTNLADGDLNWRELIGKAKQQGFDGPIAYEYVNPFKGMPLAYWDTLPEPEDAARTEAKFLREVIGN